MKQPKCRPWALIAGCCLAAQSTDLAALQSQLDAAGRDLEAERRRLADKEAEAADLERQLQVGGGSGGSELRSGRQEVEDKVQR